MTHSKTNNPLGRPRIPVMDKLRKASKLAKSRCELNLEDVDNLLRMLDKPDEGTPTPSE